MKFFFNLSKKSKLAILIIFIVYSLLILVLGGIMHREGIFYNIRNFIKVSYKIPSNYVKGLTVNPPLITINIKDQDYQKLVQKRQQALETGFLITSDQDYIPAEIKYQGKIFPVRIRLKGDNLDHLKGHKWSFRIELEGKDTLFGLKRFSIHHPKARNYVDEWLWHKILAREDVLSLKYDFIDVVVNNSHLGIYALEEHFDQQYMKNRKLEEGVIIRFNEDLTWKEKARQNTIPDKKIAESLVRQGSGSYLASEIDVFQTDKVLSDPETFKQFNQAKNNLELFRRGLLSTHEVFDTDKLAKFFALSDLMSASHAIRWINFRFYYNPQTTLLEPIGFDAISGRIISSLNITDVPTDVPLDIYKNDPKNLSIFKFNIFNDKIFIEKYVKALEAISQPEYVDDFFNNINPELEEKIKIIYKNWPTYQFNNDYFYVNQKVIRDFLNPIKGLHAYFDHFISQNRIQKIYLQLVNIQQMPLTVINLSYQDKVIFTPEKDEIILLPKQEGFLPDYQTVGFILPPNWQWSDQQIADLKVNYLILGASDKKQEVIFPWSYLDEESVVK